MCTSKVLAFLGSGMFPEDSADGAGEQDGSHETEAPAAVGALEHVDVETAPHEIGVAAPDPQKHTD
jgi:hypothetical protein